MSAPRRKITKKTDVQPSKAPAGPKPKVLKNARVRFDLDQRKWAILGANDNPTSHFTHGYMKNVEFGNISIHNGMTGCGSGRSYVGIATGDLVMGRYHKDLKDTLNLGFSGRFFTDLATGAVLQKTPLLHLFPERRALAKRSE